MERRGWLRERSYPHGINCPIRAGAPCDGNRSEPGVRVRGRQGRSPEDHPCRRGRPARPTGAECPARTASRAARKQRVVSPRRCTRRWRRAGESRQIESPPSNGPGRAAPARPPRFFHARGQGAVRHGGTGAPPSQLVQHSGKIHTRVEENGRVAVDPLVRDLRRRGRRRPRSTRWIARVVVQQSGSDRGRYSCPHPARTRARRSSSLPDVARVG